MGVLKRLFSRSPSGAGARASPDAALPAEPSEGSVIVPDGHHVTHHHPAHEPELIRSHGGTLIANLGAASDEFQEELCRISDEIDCLVSANEPDAGATLPPVLLVGDAYRTSELFAPNNPKVDALPGLLLWVVDARSAPLWLREPEPFLAAICRVGTYRVNKGPIAQFVMLDMGPYRTVAVGTTGSGEAPRIKSPSGIPELARLFTDAGACVVAVPDDGIFFMEVCRPDDSIGSVRKEPILLDNVPGTEASTLKGAQSFPEVVRAPRLRRLTLAAIEEPSERTRNQLFDELLSREVALLVRTNREGQTRQMSWPNIGKALPVYPDLSSLLQTAEDLGIHKEPLLWAALPPSELFAWVDRGQFGGVALNVYKDRDTPMYYLISRDEIFELARRRTP